MLSAEIFLPHQGDLLRAEVCLLRIQFDVELSKPLKYFLQTGQEIFKASSIHQDIIYPDENRCTTYPQRLPSYLLGKDERCQCFPGSTVLV
jgi:hypothetical protein